MVWMFLMAHNLSTKLTTSLLLVLRASPHQPLNSNVDLMEDETTAMVAESDAFVRTKLNRHYLEIRIFDPTNVILFRGTIHHSRLYVSST